ncbi:GNAT family N-acetyltransferase [Kribbella sp. NPDC051952]|uniref:GNAT family N-acetyltransferase n=1 Tax=Kribbella sp. NPDC051952 TaxID=3154851 RepID=UPI0034432C6E
MPTHLAIRPATTTDRAGIQRVLAALHPDGADSVTLPAVRQQAETFIATNDGAVVGMAVATFTDYGREPYGTIEELVVDATSRGLGIGTSLLDQCRRWLGGLGAGVVFVSAIDEDAARFYESAGFERCTGPWLFWASR